MIKKNLLKLSAMWVALLMTTACNSDNDLQTQDKSASATFNISLDSQTRAAQPLDIKNYDTWVYLYESEGAGYRCVEHKELTEAQVTLEGLNVGTQYKAVFLAVPRNQGAPELPSENIAAYAEQTAKYIYTPEDFMADSDEAEGDDSVEKIYDETGRDIFRSILSFTASAGASAQYTVLTRQNGAVEVRILNMTDIASVALHVDGHTQMYLHDGTGGQVITTEETVALSKIKNDGLDATDVRVRINLLPAEDITDKTGTKNYLELTMTDGKVKRYPFSSDQGMIPIYPNQVTWLTIGNGSATFKVTFSGNINLDDDSWDGWNDNWNN